MITNSLSIIKSFQIDDWPTITIWQPLRDFLIDNNFPAPAIQVILAFIPLILSIAYPIMIQTISSLNDRYKSTQIINAFESSFRSRFFKWNLIIAVFLTIIGLLFSVEILLLALLAVNVLLVTFLRYIDLMFRFLSAHKQFLWHIKSLRRTLRQENEQQSIEKFLLGEDDKSKALFKNILSNIQEQIKRFFIPFKNLISASQPKQNRKKTIARRNAMIKHWHPIIDLFRYTIREDDRELEYDIKAKYIYPVIRYIKYVEHKDQLIVEFPPEVYNSVYEIVLTYIRSAEKDHYQNIAVFVGSIFHSENYGKEAQFLHLNSLIATWRNLILIIENKRWDVLKSYWLDSHQYCRYNFNYRIGRHYPEDSLMDQANADDLIRRHQDLFLQVHLTIGAYLLYKKEHSVIIKLWYLTQSEPPSYYLYPTSVVDIIRYFGRYFNDRDGEEVIWLSFKYLDFDEMSPNRGVKEYVCDYLAMVFLRLYKLPRSFGSHPLSSNYVVPKAQSEKMSLKGNLVNFKRCLEKNIADTDLMESFSFDAIDAEYCKTHNFEMPCDYIEAYIAKIDQRYDVDLSKAVLDKDILGEIDHNTVKSIREAHRDISRIKRTDDILTKDRDSVSYRMETIRGTRMIVDKEALVKDSGKLILNTTNLWAQATSRTYYEHFATKVFLQDTLSRFKVPHGHMFTAIDRLNPKPSSYTIITFVVNVQYLKDSQNLPIKPGINKEDYRYNDIPIFCFDYGARNVYNTLYLIRNDQLPMIKHIDWIEVEDLREEIKNRWQQMKLIDDSLRIYRMERILDNHPELQAEYIKSGKTEEELKHMVEIDIDFIAYIWFKKGTKLIRIKEADPFQEGGNMDNLDDIKPLSD